MISIYIDEPLKKYISQIRYSLEYLLNPIGFQWKILDSNDSPDKDDILIYYSQYLPEDDVIISLAKHLTLIFIRAEKEFFTAGSFIGDTLKDNICTLKLNKPIPIITRRQFEYPVSVLKLDSHTFGCIEFDIIGNVFFHLSEDEFIHKIETSKSNKKNEDSSAFFDYVDNPYLSRLSSLMEKTILEFHNDNQLLIRKCLWPKNEKIALALSHNVDSLHKWKISNQFKAFFINFYLIITFKWGQFFKQLYSQFYYLITNKEPYWNFFDVQDKEKEYKSRSSWFLSKKQPGSSEIDYDLNDEDLDDVLKEMVHYGSEIAFLSSKKGSRDKKFAEEFNAFSNKYKPVGCGIRHQEDLFDLEKEFSVERDLGMIYDSSRFTVKDYGFVNGTCYPYKIWTKSDNVRKNKTIWEVPVNYSDKSIRINNFKNIPLDIAKNQIREIISIVKELKGVAHFSFSISSYTEIPYLDRLYGYILDQFSTISTYKATLKQIVSWLDKRDKVDIKVENNKVIIHFPEEMEDFSLQFYGNYKFVLIEGGNGSYKDKRVSFYNIQKDSTYTIHLDKVIEFDYSKL